MIGLLGIGLFAPAATPQPIVDRIAEANRKAMADPEFQKVFATGLEPFRIPTPRRPGASSTRKSRAGGRW